MRAGFQERQPRELFGHEYDPEAAMAKTPVAVSLWAPLFQEAKLLAFGAALEQDLGVATIRRAL